MEAATNQDLKVLSPFCCGLDRYLQIVLRGMTGFILASLVKTGTTVQSLKYEEFEVQPIPLAPLGEQSRLVAAVDALTELCDQLETQLRSAQAERHRLLKAVLYQAINHYQLETDQ